MDPGLELPGDARTLLDAVLAIGADVDLHAVLGRILEVSRRLTDADLSGTGRAEDAVGELGRALREVCDARLVAYVRLADGILELRQVLGDTEAAPRLVESLSEVVGEVARTRAAQEVGSVGDPTTLVVPVPTRLADPGVLVIDRVEDRPVLRGIMLDLAAVAASQVGLILDRQEALREQARLLVARDRQRIARDLHDLVIQRLFATGMQLQGARDLDASELRTRVDGTVAELDGAIKELRSVIFELGSGSGRPLLEDVRALLAEYAGVLGFQPLLRIQGPVDRALVPEARSHVLGTLREALSNVARHAGAGSATVELTASSAWFRLRVVDDGLGFDPAVAGTGHGTGNLRGRAEDLGGHLQVTSAPGQGTTLEWVIPAVG
ncbi:sensor histidine kinase [Nocardioides humi]|uniref:Oxygen sensor histidine kinase NreB n=1 Tax=Nocardioides humi TaxID=449461 RepID=A0ABN2BK91_9ACTN|nr:sensor histidine kinase [Nocardioides humi]